MIILLVALTIAAYALLIAFVITNCNKSPSERNKDFDNFL